MAGSESSIKMRTIVAFISLLFALLSTGHCNSQVPLVMWSSEGYTLPPMVSPAAGHIISRVQLMSYLNSALESAPHNVLLFLQDKLSKDDFTRYGGVFGNKQDSSFPNLESAIQSSSSPLVLPALSWLDASAVPGLLQEKLGVSPLSIDPDTLEHLRLNASDNTLLVINLPYSAGAYLPCKEVLRSNDEVIGKVLSVMKAQGVPYTAIYTGLKPSRVIEEPSMVGQSSMGRSLLQAVVDEVKPPVMFNTTRGPCIMLWAQNLNVSFNNLEWIDLGPLTFAPGGSVSTAGSFCNETNSKLVLDYGSSVPTYNPFRLIFSMSQRRYSVSARNWFTLDTVELLFNAETATYNGSRGIYAPSEYSFHCQNVNNFRNALLVPRNQNANQWRILFTDLEFIAPLQSVAFGSCQERKLFPTHCAPNRLGNKMSLEGAPHRGPGCYDNHVGTIMYDVQKRPESKKGYTLAARTSVRFLPCAQTITPSPQRYQQDRTWSKVYPPGKIPFSSTTQRFRTKPVTADSNPGPGTYAHDTTRSRKVSWHMKFGSPDWGRLPTLERKALRTKLLCDKEFTKQRSRVAYLQLFYS